MKESKLINIGSYMALLIGLPIGTSFILAMLYISLFPMFDFFLFIYSGKFFWSPITIFTLLTVFAVLLWISGKKIKENLVDNKYSIIKTSFLFTFYINNYLFFLIILIFLLSQFFFSPTKKSDFSINLIPIFLTVITYLVATFITTFTIGFLIVTITKNKIASK